jgi:hypothetical protein
MNLRGFEIGMSGFSLATVPARERAPRALKASDR